MKCEICGLGPAEGKSVFRQNATGDKSAWRCREHNEKPIDGDVDDLVRVIEQGGSEDE